VPEIVRKLGGTGGGELGGGLEVVVELGGGLEVVVERASSRSSG
jgi:hypothetical protein